MDLTPDHPSAPRALLGGRDTLAWLFNRAVACAAHAQRLKEVVAEESVQRLARHRLNNICQGDEAQAAVDNLTARLVLQRGPRDGVQHLRLPPGDLVVGVEGGQAGGMSQEVTKANLRLVALGKGREKAADRVIQAKLPPLQQHQGGGGGEELTQRGQVIDSLLAHRSATLQSGGHTVGMDGSLFTATHGQDRTRKHSLAEGALHQLVDTGHVHSHPFVQSLAPSHQGVCLASPHPLATPTG